jgi:hypothetical protein
LAKCREQYEASVAHKIREGRATGELKEYTPWLYVREVPSGGRSHIVLSATVGRAHHLLSDLEELVFYYADYSSQVTDIREQYPLFSREETAEIAASVGVKHPAIYGTNIVCTEDFLLTVRGEPNSLRAIQVKYSDELYKPDVRCKLEIQRRYFARRGIPWRIITERDLCPNANRNLQWLRAGALETFPSATALEFKRNIAKAKPSDELGRAIRRAGEASGLNLNSASLLFKRLVWTHEFELNIRVLIELGMRIDQANLSIPDQEQGDVQSM